MNKLPPLPKPVYLAVKDFDDYICGHPSDQMIVYGWESDDHLKCAEGIKGLK